MFVAVSPALLRPLFPLASRASTLVPSDDAPAGPARAVDTFGVVHRCDKETWHGSALCVKNR